MHITSTLRSYRFTYVYFEWVSGRIFRIHLEQFHFSFADCSSPIKIFSILPFLYCIFLSNGQLCLHHGSVLKKKLHFIQTNPSFSVMFFISFFAWCMDFFHSWKWILDWKQLRATINAYIHTRKRYTISVYGGCIRCVCVCYFMYVEVWDESATFIYGLHSSLGYKQV